MKCKDCIHYQKTQMLEWDIKPYIGKGYTIDEIIKLSKKDEPTFVYDCPYSSDWAEADNEANKYCDNKFKNKKTTTK